MQGHTPVMTTAVLISGGVSNLASLRAFRDSLITNLIGKSEDVEFHLFFYVRLPSDMDKEELDQELKRTGSDRVWIHRITIEDESNTKNEAQIRVDHPHYNYSAPFEFNQFNTLSMYWKLYVADQFRRRYEFETGVTFDAVVRIRPDLVLHDALDLRTLDLRRADMVHVPWFHSSMRLAFDQLAIGPPEAMRSYAKAYYNVPYLTESSALTLGFHPEHTLYMHLQDVGLSLCKLKCSTSIARRDGDGVDMVDSFARLRSEFGSAALACGEEFVTGPRARASASAKAKQAGSPGSPLLASQGAPVMAPGLAEGKPSDWLAALVDPLEHAQSKLGNIEARLGSLEEHAQREVRNAAERLGTVTAELADERHQRAHAEARLAMAERHTAEVRGLCLAVLLVAAIATTAVAARRN